MPSVYIETTIPSYLVAAPSRDLVTAAHQQITHDWWATARERFDLYISEAVVMEAREGDADYAERRMAIVAELDVLAFSEDVEHLIWTYHHKLGLVGSAIADLPHFAYAVAYNMDYLVTWNCKHIANGQVIKRLNSVNRELGLPTPVIVTPEELVETFFGEDE